MREVLQSKKTEVELVRSQLGTAEQLSASAKRDLESAQSRILELEGQLRLLSSSDSPETDDSQLRAEISRLTSQNRDFHRLDQQVKDLEVTRKSLEAEVTRLTFLLESTRTQLTEMRERAQEQEAKRREAELSLHKRDLDCEALRLESSRFAFLRESLEAEISTLKQSLTAQEAKLDKKRKKTAQLQQQHLETRSELQNAKQMLEVRLREAESQLDRVQVDLREKLSRTEEAAVFRAQQLERESAETTKELHSVTNQLREAEEKLRENDENCVKLTNSAAELQAKSVSLEEQLSKQSKEMAKLQIMLESAQKKRELARSEVIKLTQRLEQRQWEECASDPVISGSEGRVLGLLRRDLEQTYKALVTLMMTGQEITAPEATKRGLLVDAAAFGGIERRLNDLVMQAHEAVESSETPELPASWSGRITSAVKQSVRGPVKLFSCISAPADAHNPTITMKPRTAQGQKLMSGTGGPKVDSTGKRRGSLDPSS
jgi:chromosome segregation ATPase